MRCNCSARRLDNVRLTHYFYERLIAPRLLGIDACSYPGFASGAKNLLPHEAFGAAFAEGARLAYCFAENDLSRCCGKILRVRQARFQMLGGRQIATGVDIRSGHGTVGDTPRRKRLNAPETRTVRLSVRR